MIVFIRSLKELMLLTKSKDEQGRINEIINYEYDPSIEKKFSYENKDKIEIKLPELPLKTKYKLIKRKKALSRFFDTLDYNNQIQSSYDLILLQRQNSNYHKDVA